MNRRAFLKTGTGVIAGAAAAMAIPGCMNDPTGPKSKNVVPAEFFQKILSLNRPVYGAKDAKVTFVEFSDLTNPICKSAYPAITQLKGNYAKKGGNLNFAHFYLPTSAVHNAAKAVEAAGNQGKYFAMYDAVYQLSTYDDKSLFYAAGLAGLDMTQFSADYADKGGAIAAKLVDERTVSQSLGINAAPVYIIGLAADFANNRTIVEGPQGYPAFAAAVELYLKQ